MNHTQVAENGVAQADAAAGRDYVIVFGAAVHNDGSPSPTLLHRIEGALAWAQQDPAAMLIATGGVGRVGPAEAGVIAKLLRTAGVADDRILLEPCGRDTLESVRFCHRLLQAQGDCVRVVCCTSTFHQPRCTVLLRLLGYEVVDPSMSSSWRHLGRTSYAMLVAKELVATPYDMLILLARRAIGRL